MAVMAVPAAAQVDCTITASDATSYDGSPVTLNGDKITVEEGGNWQFTLTYRCTGITDSTVHTPWISFSNPGNKSFDVPDFRGGYSELDGFGDADEMTGACLEDSGCRIVFFGSSKDNNCHNQGANTQRFNVITQINNRGTDPTTNLSGERTFTVEATDDDPPTRDFFGTMIKWRPYC